MRHENVDETDMYVDWNGFDEDVLEKVLNTPRQVTQVEETEEERKERVESYRI